jgi:hypothetical protein
LDATIAPVSKNAKKRPVSKEEGHRTTPKSVPARENEVNIDDLDIGALMQILPYVFTELEIDTVLAGARQR